VKRQLECVRASDLNAKQVERWSFGHPKAMTEDRGAGLGG
jgi:hypothetical protein